MDTWSPFPSVRSGVDAIERFRELANELQPDASYGGYQAIAEPLGKLAEDRSVVDSRILDSLARIQADEKYQSPHWGEHSVVLGADRYWQLRLSLYTRSSEHIYSLPFHLAGAVVGLRSLQVDHYRLPPEHDGEVFLPGASAVPSGQRSYRPGDIFTIDSRKQAFDVQAVEPVAVLKFMMTPFMRLQWAFDRKTLKSTQAIASNPLDSELATICLTLKAMKRSGSDALLDRLSQHPAHYVRWAAIQGLGAVNPERAVERLRQALTDRHPHIRSAAANHLALRK